MKEIFLNRKKFDNKKKSKKTLKFKGKINRRAHKRERLESIKELNRALFNHIGIEYPIGGLYKIWQFGYRSTPEYGILVDISLSDCTHLVYYSFMGPEGVFVLTFPTRKLAQISQVQVLSF
jgi:hypothetical protein